MNGDPDPRRGGRLPLLALSLGHGCSDLSAAALFAVLPFLVVERHYGYAAVGLFALTASAAAAVFQPLLGAFGDRGGGFWLMPGGLVLAGVGIGAVGVSTHFGATLVAVVVCGAGVAAYHPEGARWARVVSRGHVTSDMGVFSLGGSVGYALGPLVVAAAPLIATLPLLGYGAMLPVVALIGILMSAYLSVTLVLAQEYLPAHMGLATGLTIGLSSGVAGLCVAALGVLGDRAGVAAVLLVIAVLPLVAAALGATLPEAGTAPSQPRTEDPSSVTVTP